MKTRLKPSLCYIAGIESKTNAQRSAVGIITSISALEERFIEICIKDLSIEPSKIIIEERGAVKHVYFYHSRVYRDLKRIIEDEDKIFRRVNDLSRSYVAGIFDAAGHVSDRGVYIKGLSPKDLVMLENLGIYTRDSHIRNITYFFTLMKGFSTLLEQIHPPGNERDPR